MSTDAADFLLERFREHAGEPAVVWLDRAETYGSLLSAVSRWSETLTCKGVLAGTIVAVQADFSPTSVALMIALIRHACIIVPLTSSVSSKSEDYLRLSEAAVVIEVGHDDAVVFRWRDQEPQHELLRGLIRRTRPGLVLFTSGSTGASKAIVHDFGALLEKFRMRRHARCMMTFLLFDHIGGVNTLFYALSNGGCIVTVGERTPDAVCRAVDRHGVQTLPTSPTFLNLLLLSGALDLYRLTSLDTITYGTEVMPEQTLRRLREKLPHVQLVQTYGLSEVGILRSKSESSDSLWVKLGGEGYQTRVVDGLLEIKSQSAMLGYLNAPCPFTQDGWFQTGDMVEVKGDYFRVLGRKSEIINVGGETVFPVEIESMIQSMDGVVDVAVTGEKNAITGQIVNAEVVLSTGESAAEFRRRMVAHCRPRMAAFKIPQRVTVAHGGDLHGARFKKFRGRSPTSMADAERDELPACSSTQTAGSDTRSQS
jgi:acyl-coenzyme A synthetase/AMP-(fatty) acid ligase